MTGATKRINSSKILAAAGDQDVAAGLKRSDE